MEAFATYIGVRLRVEVAHDTTEMLRMLTAGEVDVIAMSLPRQRGTLHTKSGWLVNSQASLLSEAINEWYKPTLVDSLKRPSAAKIQPRRSARPPMLDAAAGRISQYDALFQRYASTVGWDWRLLAAQCYQESAFDPNAVSWAGAQGLMQIMPATADMLGLTNIFDPESNIEAAARLLRQLDRTFSDITPQSARIPYVLAAYNGGASHVRDAMALTRHQGDDDRLWRNVESRLLLLADPAYYRLPFIKYGYLRGSETHGYVRQTMDRWAQYRGEVRHQSSAYTPKPATKRRTETVEVHRPPELDAQ